MFRRRKSSCPFSQILVDFALAIVSVLSLCNKAVFCVCVRSWTKRKIEQRKQKRGTVDIKAMRRRRRRGQERSSWLPNCAVLAKNPATTTTTSKPPSHLSRPPFSIHPPNPPLLSTILVSSSFPPSPNRAHGAIAAPPPTHKCPPVHECNCYQVRQYPPPINTRKKLIRNDWIPNWKWLSSDSTKKVKKGNQLK